MKRLGHIAFGARRNGIVQHPEILEPGSAAHRLQNGEIASLPRAVVHDGHARLQRVHEHRRVRLSGSVVRGEVQIHFADAVHRTRHLEFQILREVSEIQEAKRAEREQHPHRRGIVRRVSAPLNDAFAERVRRAGAGRGAPMSCRFEASTFTSIPFSGMVSPGCTTISFAPLAAIASRNVAVMRVAPLPVSVVGPCVMTVRNFTRAASCSMPPT